MSALRLPLPRTFPIPTLLTWTLVLAVALFFAIAYLDDGQPSPYGVCYASRGRPIPCEVKKQNGPATRRRQPASLLPVATP